MAETQICRNVVTERPKDLGCSLTTGISPRGFPRAGRQGQLQAMQMPAPIPDLTVKPWATSQPCSYARDRAVRKPQRDHIKQRAQCLAPIDSGVTDAAIYIRHIDMFLPWDVTPPLGPILRECLHQEPYLYHA